MASGERVTVTLPNDLSRDIDRREKTAVNPHGESADLAEQGLQEWKLGLPEEDTEALVDSSVG
jgi:hypothetical protein